MTINTIIHEKRKELGMTQEQVASYLGVSTPAVNKWEKGVSYPDVTLLPALARVLNTDLNTLLSFKEDMSEKEIGLFLNKLSQIADNDGLDKTFDIAMEKIKEFPTCYSLILNVALFLEGTLMLGTGGKEDESYKKTIEDLYRRSLESKDSAIQNQAKSLLISKYRQREEYEKAQELIQSLPDESPVDKKQLQATLYLKQGRLEEAAKLEEEKLLSAANEIQTTLITLMEIALKENRMEDAKYMADISKKGAELFDLWEYNSYVAHFQLYMVSKNRIKCLKTLIPMLKSLTHKWDTSNSPLYRHIPTKEVDTGMGKKFRKTILRSLAADEEADFLKESKELQALLREENLEIDGKEE